LLVTGYADDVVCGGVRVGADDLVLGDDDGVVVVPSSIAPQAVAAAMEKLGLEEVARSALEQGTGLQAMYEEHGVL
jgi:4-hydroxy-4-methyl-2-oxoglutarate aldolase